LKKKLFILCLIIFSSSIVSADPRDPWIQLLTDKPMYITQCDDIILTVLIGKFRNPQTVNISVEAYKYKQDLFHTKLSKVSTYTMSTVKNGEPQKIKINAEDIGQYINEVEWTLSASIPPNADHKIEVANYIRFKTRPAGAVEGCPGRRGNVPGKSTDDSEDSHN